MRLKKEIGRKSDKVEELRHGSVGILGLVSFCRFAKMSATVVSEAMVMTASESQPKPNGDVQFVKCDCCGLTEECTAAYIDNVRERFNGRWICGLCGEAVKDEIVRCERLVSTEEAVNRHMSFCRKFNSAGPPPNPAVHLISAMRQILRRSANSPRSMPSSPTKTAAMRGSRLGRSDSCIPSLSLVDSSPYRGVEEGSK
ncbi:hypothetical protein RJ640_008403 [Escallonia rubra]|uniref:Uncharacterized protein n=1 Tax=Escallonia rubra TaxID=112253 RepID=A0AA88RX65_9ASTE|nr:hypothetical protein RJ640_008403 [Escallonia rubra]